MTYKEAIRVIEATVFCCNEALEICETIRDCKNCKGYVSEGEDRQTHELSIKALEAQEHLSDTIKDMEQLDQYSTLQMSEVVKLLKEFEVEE